MRNLKHANMKTANLACIMSSSNAVRGATRSSPDRLRLLGDTGVVYLNDLDLRSRPWVVMSPSLRLVLGLEFCRV